MHTDTQGFVSVSRCEVRGGKKEKWWFSEGSVVGRGLFKSVGVGGERESVLSEGRECWGRVI